jgi:serine/threonine-protein kinase HipA
MDELVVLMGDRVAGRVVRMEGQRLRLRYDDAYRSDAGATPVSVSMPLEVDEHPHDRVWPWLWGLLPDNEEVITRWARHFQVARTTPFALLGTPVGEDCAGAVRFCAPERVEALLADRGSVTWLSDADIAGRLRDLRRDTTAWLGRGFTGQFSLAGAQAKTALLLESGRWGTPSGSRATTHILKPALLGFDDHDLNEHLCLAAAGRVGLTVASSEVRMFEDEPALVVRRYDRVDQDGEWHRVHQEDLCQALSVHPDLKYQNQGGPTPARIAGLFREVMPPSVADRAASRFADALAWNWVIAGTDAHAKNYSLLLAGRQVRLAPLYDVASALPYGVHERRLRMAMKVGGEYDVHPGRNIWPKAAKELSLDPDQLVARVAEICARAPDAFREAASDASVQRLGRELPERLVDLVAARAARCLRVTESEASTDAS